MDAISTAIRTARKERGWTQQLAEPLGMSRNTISGIENGTITEVGICKVEAILNSLGYTLTVGRLSGRPTLDGWLSNRKYEGFYAHCAMLLVWNCGQK